MTVRLPILFTLVVVLVASPALEAAVESLTDVVPSGSPLVFAVADVPTTLAAWRGSPTAKLWNDPQVKAFFAPLREEIRIDRWDDLVRQETGRTIDEIAAMFTGQLVVFVDAFELDLTPGEQDADFSIALLAAVGDNGPALEAVLLEQEARLADEAVNEANDIGEAVRYETREFRGVDLHLETVLEGDEVTMETGWAIVDGVLVDAYPVGTLERVVAAILDGGVDRPLDDGDSFATVARYVRGADSWVFLDMDAWTPVIADLVAFAAAEAEQTESLFPFDPAALVEALGVEALQAVFVTSEQQGEIATASIGVTYTENTGLVKLLAYGPGEAPRPSFIPAGSDAFSTSRFDVAASWSAVVEIVNGINPSLMALAAMQLQATAKQAGVELDLKRDLLDNLDGELITIQNYHGVSGGSADELELTQDQVFVLGIRQRGGIENAIENLKSIAGRGSDLFSTREFAGQTIYTPSVAQTAEGGSENQLAYVVTDRHLLVSMGSLVTLEDALLAYSGRGEAVWQQPWVQAAMAVLPRGSSVIQVLNLAAFGGVLFPIIAAFPKIDLDDGEGSTFGICDPEAVPDADVIGRYFSSAVTGAWKDDRSLVFRTWTLPAASE